MNKLNLGQIVYDTYNSAENIKDITLKFEELHHDSQQNWNKSAEALLKAFIKVKPKSEQEFRSNLDSFARKINDLSSQEIKKLLKSSSIEEDILNIFSLKSFIKDLKDIKVLMLVFLELDNLYILLKKLLLTKTLIESNDNQELQNKISYLLKNEFIGPEDLIQILSHINSNKKVAAFTINLKRGEE